MKVSIAIPAYNESANISHLIYSLLKQRVDDFELLEIMVASDGSTDETDSLVRGFSDERVKLLSDGKRRGVIERQNQLFAASTGDIVVLLNADILPQDNSFIAEIIQPIQKNAAVGLVGASGRPLPARTWFESVLNQSNEVKNRVFEKWNNGDNLYGCHGYARAFSRRLVDQFHWPATAVAEDAYSYLRCLELGYVFKFQPSAKVVFRSPNNLRDHLKQSNRFYKAKSMLEQYFGKKRVYETHSIPVSLFVLPVLEWLFFSPLKFITYATVIVFVIITNYFRKPETQTWEVAVSSKHL